jgi:hypothetical protein
MLSFLRAKKAHPLLKEIDQARRDYREAEMTLNFADPNFIDHAVHRLSTAQSQLNALIRAAKKQGLQAWTKPLPPVVSGSTVEAGEETVKKDRADKDGSGSHVDQNP